MRTHRVGSWTLGCILVVLGTVCLAHLLLPAISYEMIFKMWPVILISLGAEVLFAQVRSKKVTFVYDGWSVVLLVALVLFAMFMAGVELSFQYYSKEAGLYGFRHYLN